MENGIGRSPLRSLTGLRSQVVNLVDAGSNPVAGASRYWCRGLAHHLAKVGTPVQIRYDAREKHMGKIK